MFCFAVLIICDKSAFIVSIRFSNVVLIFVQFFSASFDAAVNSCIFSVTDACSFLCFDITVSVRANICVGDRDVAEVIWEYVV